MGELPIVYGWHHKSMIFTLRQYFLVIFTVYKIGNKSLCLNASQTVGNILIKMYQNTKEKQIKKHKNTAVLVFTPL